MSIILEKVGNYFVVAVLQRMVIGLADFVFLLRSLLWLNFENAFGSRLMGYISLFTEICPRKND